MSILVVGSIALDTIETPFGKREDILGGSCTYFSYAASFFRPVSIVGVVGKDFPPEHIELLQARGFDVLDVVPVRRQNMDLKAEVLEVTSRWLASRKPA